MCRAVGGTQSLLKDTLLCWPSTERMDRRGFPSAFELKKLHLGGDLECQVPLSPVLPPDTSHWVLSRRGGFPSSHPLFQQVHALSAPPIGSRLFPTQALQTC